MRTDVARSAQDHGADGRPQIPRDRRAGVRNTTLVLSLIVLVFYFGFIVMAVLKAAH